MSPRQLNSAAIAANLAQLAGVRDVTVVPRFISDQMATRRAAG
jgi:hypothetical protein